ncbi:hypothetical protein BDW62DRAFT_188365 [Aspergillus aurantiobrunneus]
MIVALTSSISSTIITTVSSIYGTFREIGNFGASYYILGFPTGPLIRPPFSEWKRRQMSSVLSMFGFRAFSFATATSKDLQSNFICRF